MHSMSEKDRERVIAAADQEVEAVRKGDIGQYLALLSRNASFMPPNTTTKRGGELRAWLSDFLERFSARWLSYEHGETEVSGDLAYHDYTYGWEVTPKAGGETTVGHGKGLQVFGRQADGSWMLVRSIWNATPAPGTR
jgi:ketosteroid isomerase-like protein